MHVQMRGGPWTVRYHSLLPCTTHCVRIASPRVVCRGFGICCRFAPHTSQAHTRLIGRLDHALTLVQLQLQLPTPTKIRVTERACQAQTHR